MTLPYFLSFILVLALAWTEMYWATADHFNGIREYKQKTAQLRAEIKEERLKTKLAKEEFLEFRQDVATLMPQVLPVAGKGEEGYPLRNLAAVLAVPASDKVRSVVIKSMFEHGQELFRKKKYEESNKVFKQFIEKYSYSERTPEAYFLWLDGAFKLGDYRQCVDLAHEMVELFPGTELTGFALLRLGKIYEMQGRAEDAVDIYKTVLRSYAQRDVASQAKASLRGVDL
jgi:TolA-binding protein